MYNVFMFNWLKMHFIPHAGNGHRPHILHQKNIHRIIGFVIFIEAFAFLVPTIALISNADTGNVVPSVLTTLTNNERAQFKLAPLTSNPLLDEAAQEKADDMAANSYFSHISPTGKTPWYWLDQVGYTYSYAGENLAINFTNSNDVTTAWMNSPTHRANILKADYTQVGTGVAAGVYQGNPTIFVAQDFGSPSAAVAPVAQKSTLTEQPEKVATTVTATGTSQVLAAHSTPHPAVATVTPPAPIPPVVTTAPIVAVQPQAPPESAILAAAAHPTLLQRMLASPRTTTNTILIVILSIVTLAVFLNIGIKVSQHHPDLILNGVMVIAIIGTTFVMNSYITQANPLSTQSIDFTANHTIL
jgi:hypothetical protein